MRSGGSESLGAGSEADPVSALWRDPREALVGWDEVGAIRWVRSSVHARVCGGVYVKNMHETISRKKHGMRQ